MRKSLVYPVLSLLILNAFPASLHAQWKQTEWPASHSFLALYTAPDIVFARIWDSLNGARVFLTSDNGTQWNQIASADDNIDILSLVGWEDNILAGAWDGLFRLVPGDPNGFWYAVEPNGIPVDTAIESMAIIDSTLYAGARGGIYESSIKDVNGWREVGAGIPSDARVTCVATNGKAVYAGSASHGVFVASNDGGHWAAINSGLNNMHAYMEQYRETLRSFGEPYASAPIGSDHYQGYNQENYQLSVESAIALAETLKDHNPNGYVEDIIDWWIDGGSGLPSMEVADATDMRLQTGEDMFSFDQFKPWADIGALDNFHPEPNTFGGFNQTLLAATYADSKGIQTYYHNSSGPIAMAAYAHLAAVTPGFVALEYHQMDRPWHDDLVDGPEKPMIQDGYTFVPEGPGLGVTPNAERFAAHGASRWTRVI